MLELLAVTEEEEEEEVKVPRLHILAPVDYSGLPPPSTLARLRSNLLLEQADANAYTRTHIQYTHPAVTPARTGCV